MTTSHSSEGLETAQVVPTGRARAGTRPARTSGHGPRRPDTPGAGRPAAGDPAGPLPRSRPLRLILGRPEDPRWARPALLGVLALAAVLHTWALGRNGYANEYYAAAVLSGTHSWKAFFFGALDAGSFITVDKPPFALWVMGLPARVFGFGAWSMLLPQAVAGVASVGLVHSAVRRALTGAHGHAAGLVAALVMTLTPITVAINRDNNPDTVLVLLLVAAAWFCAEAIKTGRMRTLVLCGVLVGAGFMTKMLQAYLVLPAFALVYLYGAPGALLRRLGHLLAAGVALLVSSAWWMAVVDLWPASGRPYIGGSTDNTVWDLVIGYNGLGRVFGGAGNRGAGTGAPVPAPQHGGAAAFGVGGGGGGGGFGGGAGLGVAAVTLALPAFLDDSAL
ncbi:glycosyltransferase family 39 protein, partial [Sphaerisporangium dianthi]